MIIHRLDSGAEGFQDALDDLLAWEAVSDARLQQQVDEIIQRVRREGDTALLEYSVRFDRLIWWSTWIL